MPQPGRVTGRLVPRGSGCHHTWTYGFRVLYSAMMSKRHPEGHNKYKVLFLHLPNPGEPGLAAVDEGGCHLHKRFKSGSGVEEKKQDFDKLQGAGPCVSSPEAGGQSPAFPGCPGKREKKNTLCCLPLVEREPGWGLVRKRGWNRNWAVRWGEDNKGSVCEKNI